ncbi:MAG: DUF3592 domain-containing protein [Candidatus Sulfotelmatobacter sp.]
MFSDLYDDISLLFYRRWPSVEGEITAVRILGSTARLLVEYSFSVEDTSYIGEAGRPSWSVGTAPIDIRERFPVGQSVTVRYRPDNPSVNKLDRSVWEDLEGL